MTTGLADTTSTIQSLQVRMGDSNRNVALIWLDSFIHNFGYLEDEKYNTISLCIFGTRKSIRSFSVLIWSRQILWQDAISTQS